MQHLVQYLDSDGARRVGRLDNADATSATQLSSTDSVYALMHRGLHERRALTELVDEFCTDERVSIIEAANTSRLLPAFDHPVTASRSFMWLDDAPPTSLEIAPLPQRTASIGGLQSNTRAYTVDMHQHLRLVGHMHVAHADTLMFDAVLAIAADGQDTHADKSQFTNPGSDAFETALKSVTELRFGDVHFQVHKR